MIDVVLLLILVALIPARRFPGVLRRALRLRWLPLLLLLPALALNARIAGALLYPAISLGLFLEMVARWSVPHRDPGPFAWIAWFAVAGIWSLPALWIVPVSDVSDAHVAFWLLDLTNQLHAITVAPLLQAIGSPTAEASSLSMLTELARVVDRNVIGLVVIANLGLAALLYEIIRGKAPDLPARGERLRPRPGSEATSVGLLFVVGGLMAPMPAALEWLYSISVVGFGLCGLWTLLVLGGGRGPWLSAIAALTIASAFSPAVRIALITLGVGTALLDVAGRVDRASGMLRFAARRREALLVSVRRHARMPAVIGIVVLMIGSCTTLGDPIVAGPAEEPDATRGAPREHARSVAVDAGDGTIDVDVYEHPNRQGQMPTTGIGAREADEMCRAEGRRLCTRDQWAWACSAGGETTYQHLAREAQKESFGAVLESCNLGREEGLTESGAHPECRTGSGIHDMAGNAYEWVRFQDDERRFGLVGSYYGYDDNMTAQCEYVVVVHDVQLDAVDLDMVGFRCCGG